MSSLVLRCRSEARCPDDGSNPPSPHRARPGSKALLHDDDHGGIGGHTHTTVGENHPQTSACEGTPCAPLRAPHNVAQCPWGTQVGHVACMRSFL
ncbi:MAG: hypothetical protein ACK559_42150, partial [bacterium]